MNILKMFAMLSDTNLHYLKVAVLQDVISYSLIDIYQCLKETYLYQQVALKRPYTSTRVQGIIFQNTNFSSQSS
jgi:hypothetical protein